MYTAGPPVPDPPAPARLLRVECQVFGEGGPFGWDDHIYFPDLMRSYGLRCRPEQFAGHRNSFTDMATAMLARLAPAGDHFDLAVLTGATPDAQPGFPACRLSQLAGRPGLAFAIFDQGVVTSFTALRVLTSATWAGGASRTLLLVLDQSTVLHERPVAPRHAVRHDVAVALLLDPAGELGRLGVPVQRVAPPRLAGAGLATALAGIWPDPPTGDQVLVCGYGLARHLPDEAYAGEEHRCPPGQPGTAVWAELARGLKGWADRGASVVLADYDEDQQRLALCPVQPASAPRVRR